jgi:phosphorylase/glycogen(starch) synthase
MRKGWEQLEIRESNFMNDAQGQLLLGKEFKSYITVFVGDMDPNDIGIELVYARQNAKGRYVKEGVYTFEFEKIENGVATYSSTIVPNTTGAYQIAGRIFAKSDKLPHRQDFELVRWL